MNIWQKVDGIEYYEKKVEKYSRDSEQERNECSNLNAGVCFVTCNTRILAKEIIAKGLKSEKNLLNMKNWVFKQAPMPSDINWASIGIEKSMSISVASS